MRFWKYHALGNDYIVMDPKDLPAPLTVEQVKVICHRNFGVGSDGILLLLPSTKAPFGLRIYNPDGSQAEKSGNGLRIFSRFLWDRKLVGDKEFAIETAGGVVKSTVFDSGKMVRVEMGKVTFWSNEIPVTGPRREVINEKITVGGETFTFCSASVGNPHCVVVGRGAQPPGSAGVLPASSSIGNTALAEITESMAKQYGPLLETHSNFPNRINVQFLKVLDRANIQIEIWERGAGYTLASGSSSSAAAGVAHKLGLVDRSITVHMPGGKLSIEIRKDFDILMTGPVTKVSEGTISEEIFTGSIRL